MSPLHDQMSDEFGFQDAVQDILNKDLCGYMNDASTEVDLLPFI